MITAAAIVAAGHHTYHFSTSANARADHLAIAAVVIFAILVAVWQIGRRRSKRKSSSRRRMETY